MAESVVANGLPVGRASLDNCTSLSGAVDDTAVKTNLDGYSSASAELAPTSHDIGNASPPHVMTPKPRSAFGPVAIMEMPDFQLEQSQAWLAHLQANGVVRIRGVLSPEEISASKELFWDWLESLGGGARRNDPTTWTDENIPGLLDKGFFCTRGGGQCAAAWSIRGHPRVRRAFEEIWGTTELISSFDTFIGWRPWWGTAHGKESWKPRTEGIHCDQNPHTKIGRHCVQGMVPLRPVRRDIGGLCVAPGSHTETVQSHLRELFPNTKSDDWLPLELKYPKDEYNLCGELVEAEAGDLILWDSRALHGGYVGTGPPGKLNAASEFVRLSKAVCMIPRGDVSQEDLARRQAIVEKGLTTTHWPLAFKKQAGRDTNGTALMALAKWQETYKPPPLDALTQSLISGTSQSSGGEST